MEIYSFKNYLYLYFIALVWTEWSLCSQTCGSAGTRTRVKYSFDSLAAQDTESESCPGNTCPEISTSTLGLFKKSNEIDTDILKSLLTFSSTNLFTVF